MTEQQIFLWRFRKILTSIEVWDSLGVLLHEVKEQAEGNSVRPESLSDAHEPRVTQ